MKMTVNEIVATGIKNGDFYFSPHTMRFFGTKIEDHVFQGEGGTFLVVSDLRDVGKSRKVRKYHVVYVDPRCIVHRALASAASGEGMEYIPNRYYNNLTEKEAWDIATKLATGVLPVLNTVVYEGN